MPGRAALVSLASIATALLLAMATAGGVFAALAGGSGQSQPSAIAMNDIPADYLTLYQQAAATCPGLDWAILAAIGKIESDHGRSRLPGVHSGHNPAGAEGPMQFLPATFRTYDRPIPDGGANPPSPYDPTDAIFAAARYLCASGARDNRNIETAIFTYNHSTRYVDDVLVQAAEYRASISGGSDPAQIAVAFAEQQIGKPYVWGGNGNPGFDCSGLTHAAYAAAGIALPRTADAQFHAEPHLPGTAGLQLGDLVFYDNPHGYIHHVGIAIDSSHMIDAPDQGETVRIDPIRHPGDDYAGADRPTTTVRDSTAPKKGGI